MLSKAKRKIEIKMFYKSVNAGKRAFAAVKEKE